MATLVEMAVEANTLKTRVSIVFQLDGGWQANLVPTRFLQSDVDRRVFGRGATPEAALEAALVLLRQVAATDTSDDDMLGFDEAQTPAPSDVDDLLG